MSDFPFYDIFNAVKVILNFNVYVAQKKKYFCAKSGFSYKLSQYIVVETENTQKFIDIVFCSCKKNLCVVIYIYNATKTYDCAKN